MTNFFAYVKNNNIEQLHIHRGTTVNGKHMGELSDDATYIANDLYPLIYNGHPNYDDFYQILDESTFVFDVQNQQVTQQWTISNKSLEDVVTDMKNSVSAERYESEVSGIVYAYDDGSGNVVNHHISTDRESQSLMTGVRMKIKDNQSHTVNWKTYEGWIVINKDNIIDISDVVFTHVENCFDEEQNIHMQIETAVTNNSGNYQNTINALKNINISF